MSWIFDEVFNSCKRWIELCTSERALIYNVGGVSILRDIGEFENGFEIFITGFLNALKRVFLLKIVR